MEASPSVQTIFRSGLARDPRFLTLFGVTALLAAAVRLPGIGARDFWFDESCTFIYVHNLLDWPAGSNLLVESTNLPYYVLLRGWTSAFGESEAVYRSLSAVAAILTVPLLAWFAWHIAGAWAGWCCGLLAALHPLHVYYAREARAYSLWMLVLSAAMVLMYQACRRERWRWWIAFGLVLLLALHLHYFTAWWAMASVAGVAIAVDSRRFLKRWSLTIVAVVLVFLPYCIAAVLPAAAGGGNKWIAKEFEPLLAVPKTLWAFLPAGGYPPHLRGLSLDSPDALVRQPVWLAAGAQIVPALVMILALFFNRLGGIEPPRHQGTKEGGVVGVEPENPRRLKSAARQAFESPRRPKSAARRTGLQIFLLGVSVGPLLLAWLYSLLVRPNYLVARYDLVAWPAFMVWLGVVLAGVPRSAMRVFFLFALIVCTAVPLHRLLAADPPPSLHRLRAERLAESARLGDLVIAFSYDRDYLQYYLHRAGFAGAIRSFPTWLETQVGWLDTEADLQRRDEAREDATLLASDIAQRVASGAGVYILADSMDPRGTGKRGLLNALLLAALDAVGLGVEPADSEYLIFRVAPL